jgi:hypothetical protein
MNEDRVVPTCCACDLAFREGSGPIFVMIRKDLAICEDCVNSILVTIIERKEELSE